MAHHDDKMENSNKEEEESVEYREGEGGGGGGEGGQRPGAAHRGTVTLQRPSVHPLGSCPSPVPSLQTGIWNAAGHFGFAVRRSVV